MANAQYGNFDLLKKVPVENSSITISKWQSRVTGLSVVHIDYEAPIVKGYFAVGTEIFNDTGCPHTLEHLVFMGSEQYPYKGVLDNLANRAFAEGTNAWTDTDNTVYTISTAGQQGFLQILPVYVDHILYPTMTKAGFVTEVHHIDPKGNDSGVVYSEMQGRESTSYDLVALKSQRLMYGTDSAYRSETGGLMEALRKLDVETIRNYHASYYVPHNLSLIVAGSLSTQALLDTLQTHVEPRIISHGQDHGPKPKGWKRPFLETPSASKPVFKETIKETVEFPEKDESTGELSLKFIGPGPNDNLQLEAINLIGIYLTDSAAAPLNKEFIEIANPYCTDISFTESSRSTFSELSVYFSSVPVEHVETLGEKFRSSLARIIKEGIDMKRMETILDREIRKHKSHLESSGGDLYSYAVIGDFLYGAENGDDLPSMVHEYKSELKTWTSDKWCQLLNELYAAPSYIAVIGKPSAALATKLETDEKARVAKQVEQLGPEGLKHAAQELEEAKAEHETVIPDSVLTQFPVPDVGSISWIGVQSAKNVPEHGHKEVQRLDQTALVSAKELQNHIEKDKVDLDLNVWYDHVQSDFVTVNAFLSLNNLPNELRPYAILLSSALYSLPVQLPDGTLLTHEQVIHVLDQEAVAYDSGLGIEGLVSSLYRVSIKVEKENYATAIEWLNNIIYYSVFDVERLGVTLAKIQQSLPELKRDGRTVNSSVLKTLLYDQSAMSLYGELMGMIDWVPKIVQELKDEPEKVVAKLEQVRKIVTEPSGFRFSVFGNILSLPNPRSAFGKFHKLAPSPLLPLVYSSESLTPLGKKPAQKVVVVSMPQIESSFATHVAQGITGFDHPDYAALRVTMEVLDGTESFLWKYIRGSGLAYGCYLGLNTESGILTINLYRSPDSYKGFVEAKKVVSGLADGSIELKQTALDAAKSSLVFSITRSVSSPGKAALASFSNQVLKGVSQTWQQDMLAQFNTITHAQVLDMLRKYIVPLFDPASSFAVIASGPSKVEDISNGFIASGFTVEQRSLDVSPDEAMEQDESGSDSGSESD